MEESSLTQSRRIGLWLGPLLFLIALLAPAPESLSLQAQRMGAVVLLMAVFWITEAVPIAITALLPIALYPLLHIATSKQTALAYGNHLLFLFIGGCLIAAGLQKWNLHPGSLCRSSCGLAPTSSGFSWGLCWRRLSYRCGSPIPPRR